MSRVRTNVYLDRDQLEVLKVLAISEQSNVSDLVREGIERVIAERSKQGRGKVPAAQQRWNELLKRVGGQLGSLPESEIEEDITSVTA